MNSERSATNWLDGSILYTTNFNLKVSPPAEGGTLAAYTNDVAAGNDSWPLALIDEVKLVATPASELWWVEWVKTNDVEIGRAGSMSPPSGGVIDAALPVTNSFTMPLSDVAVTAQFRYVGVELQSNAVAHASAKFYTNGVEVAATGDKTIVVTNTPAVVVYTAAEGYFFEHGLTAITNALDTTKNPATGDSPLAPMEPVAYCWPEYVDGIASNGIAAWHTSTVTNFTVVTSAAERVTWGAGWYVVVGDDIRIDGGVACAGHVNLVLCDGAKLTVTNVAVDRAGIQTDASGSFTIYGQPYGAGELVATGGQMGAGIGSAYEGPGSNITINGGTVTASGGENSAGIGGGQKGDGSALAINGGTVTASGGVYGAGIGGGIAGNGSVLAINGGTVTASGGKFSAGIGGGCTFSGGTSSDITINGGTVTAIGGIGGAGIGGGFGGAGQNISIVSGLVFVATAEIKFDASTCGANDLIGCGYGCASAVGGNSVSADAKVFFNLTGLCDVTKTPHEWPEAIAAMPTNFEGITIMTRGTQTLDRVLVSGCGGLIEAALPWALTNAVTGATGEIAVDAENHTDFANVFLRLTNDVNNLTLKVEEPTFAITQQPNVTNLYAIAAETDGSDGIVNYAWRAVASGKVVAEGATLTTFPPEKGEVGSNYLCRVTYGHHGTYYTADSEAFGFHYPIVAEPTPIDHTTWTVYTNGAASAEVGSGKWAAWSNETAVVVYTADSGYTFLGGATVLTNKLDTLKNPATNLGADPFPVPRDVVVASNMGENPCFSEVETNELGEVVSFVFEGKDYFVGLNAFPSFAEAFTNETFVPFATNLHVFGYQTITEEPPMVFDWTFDFVAYTDATGATNMPSVSIATIDDGVQAYSRTLVNITNTLDTIVGDGVIVLSVTNGTPGAAEYEHSLTSLIGEENVVVLYTNFEPERENDTSPETGNPVVNETLTVDDKSKVDEETGAIVLPGLDTSGKATVEVKEGTSNDVVVAGKLVSHEWDVVIVNETTNTLTVGAVETGMNVLITNVTDTGKIVTLENVIAGKKIKIDNNGHLEATANATDSIEIRNTALNTLVGTYKAGGTIDITGEYGSLSNVVVDATGDLTLTGTNVVSGPVTLKAASIVNDPTCSELDWSVAGDNHTTMIDWDWISDSTAFGVLVDADQTDGDVNGEYVLASNVTASAVGTTFRLAGGSLGDAETLTVGADKDSTEKTYIGAKAYRLYLDGTELRFEIAWGRFDAVFNYYEDIMMALPAHASQPAAVTNAYYVNKGLTLPTDWEGESGYDLDDAWGGTSARVFLGWSATNEWDDIDGERIVWNAGGGSDGQNGLASGYYPTGLVTNIVPGTTGDREFWARWTYVDTWNVGAEDASDVTATLNEATGELALTAASAGAEMADGTDPGDAYETFAADTVLPWYCLYRSLVRAVRVSANVGKIGAYAFCNNPSLEEVFFEGGVPTCDDTAFQNCPFAVGYYPSELASSWSMALDAEGRFHGLTMYAIGDVPACAGGGWSICMTVDGHAFLTVDEGVTEVTVTSNPKGYLIVAPDGVTVKNAASVPQGRTEVRITGIAVGGDKMVSITLTGAVDPVLLGNTTLHPDNWQVITPTSKTTVGETTTVVFPSGDYRFFKTE